MSFQKLTDEQLVEKIRQGDSELYSEVIRRFQTKLGHYLRKFVRDSDELDDVLQEVFIKTYKNLNAFDVDKKFSSWIYRIAHNEAINHIKKNKNHIQLDEVEYKILDEKIDMTGDLDNKILRQNFDEMLVKLKPKYRQPLILFFFEQKSYQEIGDILHIPTSSVGTLISRGKKELAKIYESK